MKHLFAKVNIRLVKESNCSYDAPRRIYGAEDIVAVMNRVYEMDEQAEEHLIAMYLNTKHEVISLQEISKGTLNASLIHPREVLKGAILANAQSFVLCHNHPSGDVEPSNADRSVTEMVKKAGELMQIELLDHVIIGAHVNGYTKKFSFRENNIL